MMMSININVAILFISIQDNKKPCRKISDREDYLFNKINYGFFCCGVAGTVLAGAADCGAGAVLLVFTLFKIEVSLVACLPLKKKVEKIESNATMMAKIQVPFSNTSVVCFTPMN